jgi:putative phosphonate metabolism protein
MSAGRSDSGNPTLRYAVYFSPAESHPLSKAAARWLGRDAFTGETWPTPEVEGLPAGAVEQLTAEPRRYAFHATLKAPFELAEAKSEADLVAELERFAIETMSFEIPKVVIGQLGRFFALVPELVYPELQDFAARVVERFEPFRAPLTEADIARRKPESLSPAQRANLDRWGYPHVMDEFSFHMTLTGRVPPEQASASPHSPTGL